MNKLSIVTKHLLSSMITKMSEDLTQFVKNPGKDFTRKRKLGFSDIMKSLISMGGTCLRKELRLLTDYDLNTPTVSAFVQQRDKILPYAFEYLLRKFTGSCQRLKTFNGYRLFADDGTDLQLVTDRCDATTYFDNTNGKAGYNLLHINALYDLLNKLFVDVDIQPRKQINENAAMIKMISRLDVGTKAIFIADRNFESYNNFAHIENKGWNYLIRVKDGGKAGIASGLDLPTDGEFDICVRRTLVRSRAKVFTSRPDIYKCLSGTSPFDFLDSDNKFYDMELRVVRVRIAEDTYETLITNLGQSDFPMDVLKQLYHLRWGVETAFRHLKHTVGLSGLHSKKRDFVIQEIFARVIMYNFAEIITMGVITQQKDTKYIYQVNFSAAIDICRRFLRLLNNSPPLDVEALILKETLPIRPGRSFYRRTHRKSAVSFNYRIA